MVKGCHTGNPASKGHHIKPAFVAVFVNYDMLR